MKVVEHNREAWDRECQNGNPATIPYLDERIEAAKLGKLEITLTENRQLPPHWYGTLSGSRVLCLALGGGQQVPLIAALGARVVSVDNSPRQLASDVSVASRHGLQVETVLGDMQQLSSMELGQFDIAFVGLGLQFVPEPRAVWDSLAGRLRSGGVLIAAFVNPAHYVFGWPEYGQGILNVRHRLPYSDLTSLSAVERSVAFDQEDPIEYGHTFEDLLGGVTEAGFKVTGLMEDAAPNDRLSDFMAAYFVFRATLS